MVEIAPSTIEDLRLIDAVIQSAVKLAESVCQPPCTMPNCLEMEVTNLMPSQIKYKSLGTFEFLVHDSRPEFYLLEVNPRLQVEHTVTEEVHDIDLVRVQLLLAQGMAVDQLIPPDHRRHRDTNSRTFRTSIQLRVTAENPDKDFMLSMGRVTHFQSPDGRGVRTDTFLSGAYPVSIGSSYDSLLAKIIVTAPSFEEARCKGLRALTDTHIQGVETNIPVLMGILSAPDFKARRCSIRWLENNLGSVLQLGRNLVPQSHAAKMANIPSLRASSSSSNDLALGDTASSTTFSFKKGDSFKLNIDDALDGRNLTQREYIISLDRIARNAFPTELLGDVTLHSGGDQKARFTAGLTEATAGTSAARSSHRRGDAGNPNHVVLPLPGNVVEVLVDEGNEVVKDEVLMVVRQMKMEVEIRAPKAGVVVWACEFEPEEVVSEGMLVCELESDASKPRL